MTSATYPELNVELLDEVMAHIEALYAAQEEGDTDAQWSQGVWRRIDVEELEGGGHRCKTAMCFAGWAVELTGGRWLAKNGHADVAQEVVRAERGDSADEIEFERGPRGGNVRVVFASARARRLLGLTWREANELFTGRNSLEDLRTIVADIKAELWRNGVKG